MAVMTAVAVGTLAVGAYSAYSANSNASKARKQQGQAMDQQAQAAQDQLNFDKERYANWEARFNPIMDDLTTEAYADNRPDYMGIAADNNIAFDTSQAMNRRQQNRYGISPTDGATQASETQYGIGRALSLVGANTSAREAAKGQKFSKLSAIYGLGSGQGAQAMAGVNGAYGAVGAAAGNAANMYAGQAAGYSQAAAAGAQMAGYGLGQLSSSPWASGASTVAPTVASSPSYGVGGASPWSTGPSPWATGTGG
jgi:hypothetical protein